MSKHAWVHEVRERIARARGATGKQIAHEMACLAGELRKLAEEAEKVRRAIEVRT